MTDVLEPKETQASGKILWALLWLALPTMIEEVLSTLLQYVDTAMVGHLGEQATAAVSITTTITWLVNSVMAAVGTALLAMIARSSGSRDSAKICRISQQALLLTGVCGLFCGGASLILSPYIPVWMGAEEVVRPHAQAYFFIISLPMVFRAATIILGAAIRAVQDTKTPMLISLAANSLNLLLNYGLIYRCNLGVEGAAIASAIAYTLSGSLMFWAYRRTVALSWAWRSFAVDTALLKRCAAIGLPVLATSAASCLGYIVFAALVSDMGTMVFAAHSLAVAAETIFYIPGYGLRVATSTLVGEALGEGSALKLKKLSKASVLLAMGMMTLNGILLYLVAEPFMMLFTSSWPVATLGAKMLRLVAFSEPFFGLMIVLEGIFYGLGRTQYAFWVETGSMWGVRIAATFCCVKIWQLDLQAVWFCMIADNICKAVLFALPFFIKPTGLKAIPMGRMDSVDRKISVKNRSKEVDKDCMM